jgi:hypothetical protein
MRSRFGLSHTVNSCELEQIMSCKQRKPGIEPHAQLQDSMLSLLKLGTKYSPSDPSPLDPVMSLSAAYDVLTHQGTIYPAYSSFFSACPGYLWWCSIKMLIICSIPSTRQYFLSMIDTPCQGQVHNIIRRCQSHDSICKWSSRPCF